MKKRKPDPEPDVPAPLSAREAAVRAATDAARRAHEARRRAVDTILPHEAQAFLLDLARLLEHGAAETPADEELGLRLLRGAAARLRRLVADARGFEAGRRPVSTRPSSPNP